MNAGRDHLRLRHSRNRGQYSLFPSTLDDLVAETSVSADEMRLWHERAWLSFEPSGLIQFTQGDRLEVQFLRGLARSGLSDAMITRLLNAGLEKPYCYDPAETFFSFFMNTWISLPPEPDPEEVADAYVDGLIRDEDWDALRQFQARISQALAEADALESDGARSQFSPASDSQP